MNRAIALIVVEGALEVPASLKILQSLKLSKPEASPVNKGGRLKFWRDIRRYNRAAASLGPVLGIADLESDPCPSGLIHTHLPEGLHNNCVLRIAERMLESWLMADTKAMSRFLRVSETLLPRNPDAESHPKLALVNLARRSPLRPIKADIVPELGSAGIVGKGYTPRMTEFIEKEWRPLEASKKSESLRRAIDAITRAVQS